MCDDLKVAMSLVFLRRTSVHWGILCTRLIPVIRTFLPPAILVFVWQHHGKPITSINHRPTAAAL